MSQLAVNRLRNFWSLGRVLQIAEFELGSNHLGLLVDARPATCKGEKPNAVCVTRSNALSPGCYRPILTFEACL